MNRSVQNFGKHFPLAGFQEAISEFFFFINSLFSIVSHFSFFTNTQTKVLHEIFVFFLRYYVQKNVSAKCKLYCKVKDGEKVKQTDVWKTVMNSFEDGENKKYSGR
jgi:hypothetical protein